MVAALHGYKLGGRPEVETSEKQEKLKVENGGRKALAGGLSGIISRVVVSPLDVIKIRFQLEMHWPHSSGQRYHGVFQSFHKILSEEGIRGLWKGTMPSLGLWFVYAAVQFPVYESCKRFLQEESLGFGTSLGSSSLVAGALGAFAGTLVSYPLDTVRTQWVFQGLPQHMTLRGLITHAWRQDGVAGFYRGFTPAVAQVVPSMALSFYFYEMLKRIALKRHVGKEGDVLGPVENLAVGGSAGVLSKLLVYPLDTAKKRLQVNHMIGTLPTTARYSGLLDCVVRMIREEGMRSLFKGTAPTLLKSGFASAVTFTTYEIASRSLQED